MCMIVLFQIEMRSTEMLDETCHDGLDLVNSNRRSELQNLGELSERTGVV